jgi:hypothetical protein
MRFSTAILALSLCGGIATYAAPKIEVDKTTIDCGTVVEWKTDQIKALFTIRNTGDELLKINNVRPGCGCTVVKYDTLVPVGKFGIIQSTVNIAGFHSGPLSKFITVSSNAVNSPSLKLTVTATISPVIDISAQTLSLSASKPSTVYLACEKKDLRVYEVVLQVPQAGAAQFWESNAPVTVPFTWTPTDSVRRDGFRVYKLEVKAPGLAGPLSGKLVIKTNNPDKQNATIDCTVEK